MGKVQQKVAFVTGGARRIGREIVRYLHHNGLNVVVHYHKSSDDAHLLFKELNEVREHSCYLVQGDLSDDACYGLIADNAISHFGRLDLLVNNASVFTRTPTISSNAKMWDNVMNVNSKAPYFLAQCAYSALKETQGAIINITDIHGQRPLKDYGLYSLSKASLIYVTKVLALEFSPDVRVNSISPGAICWPEGDNALTTASKEKLISRTLLNKQGTPHDISEMVWSLFNTGKFITGQNLNIDGGRLLKS